MSTALLSPAATTPSPEIAQALLDAAGKYSYTADGLVIPCPYVGIEMEPAETGGISIPAKATPYEFQRAAAEAYARIELGTEDYTEQDVVKAVSDELRRRRIGVDCSGFAVSVLHNGLGSLGINAFTAHTPYHDLKEGYPLHRFANQRKDGRAEKRRQAIDSNNLSPEMRADLDMQRIVDNSEPVSDGQFAAGDVVLYDPFSIDIDPRRRGHVSLVTRVKGNRLTLMHSHRGKNGDGEGRVSSYYVTRDRFLTPGKDKHPAHVRRMNAIAQAK